MKGLRIKLRGAFALLILLASCAGYQEAEKALAPGFPQEESISAPSMSEASKAPSAVAEPTVRYLSADDSNSAASPVIARKIIRSGRYVHPSLVRTYEFLNYYSFDYTPTLEQPIAVVPQLRALNGEGDFSLQVAVRSQDRTLPELSPFNITFLLDTSGSMAGAPLELSRALILGIAGKLRPDDQISLVTCNRQTEVIFIAQRKGRLPQGKLAGILEGIKADDVTDLEAGVVKAYEIAGRNYDYRYLNRVVLISDGGANAGQLAVSTIAEHAEDSDQQGIYLTGIGVGAGFNDQLMNAVTDKGRGAYLFVDGETEVQRILEEDVFISAFDLAVKDVRLKMVMPAGWKMEEFHGEQVSTRAEDIVPQYLSPNDQMIYHLILSTKRPLPEAGEQRFEFEVEYSPIGGRRDRLTVRSTVAEMLGDEGLGPVQILKGDAIVAYAEMLKTIRFPLETHRRENLSSYEEALREIRGINEVLKDPELNDVLALLDIYGGTLRYGEKFPGSRDGQESSPGAVLGLDTQTVRSVSVLGNHPEQAVQARPRLLDSQRLVPMEGYQFLLVSSGPVGNPFPAGSGELSGRTYPDPMPAYMGYRRLHQQGRQRVFDLHRVTFELSAPRRAKSFSFDFNFFSSEYPEYVNQNFNDTFYAVIEAASTNNGQSTNIAFDANNNPIEVDNNYFQNPFHPIPNTGTGFDAHGSTGWLRTSWPIRGGESFTLTFSIHDEGDGIYDSLVILDNFQWHEYDAVGTTDPLN